MQQKERKPPLILQNSSPVRKANIMDRSEGLNTDPTEQEAFLGYDDSEHIVKNSIKKSFLTTTTVAPNKNNFTDSFDTRSFHNNNKDTILMNRFNSSDKNSFVHNNINEFSLVNPLEATQQSTHDQQLLLVNKQQDDCRNQIMTSSTYLNCSNQDLYDDIDFHPENINFSDMRDLWEVKEPLNIIFRVSLVAPIVLLGILGNLTIIYSMYKFKPFRSKPTNIFILNMAIADFLTTLVCPNAALFSYIYQFYVLGPFICRIEGFVKSKYNFFFF